jgi:hypothetical protein
MAQQPQPGDKVTITGGTYAGRHGTFIKVVGIGTRARVVLYGEERFRTLGRRNIALLTTGLGVPLQVPPVAVEEVQSETGVQEVTGQEVTGEVDGIIQELHQVRAQLDSLIARLEGLAVHTY